MTMIFVIVIFVTHRDLNLQIARLKILLGRHTNSFKDIPLGREYDILFYYACGHAHYEFKNI